MFQKIVLLAGVLFTVISLTVLFAAIPPGADPTDNVGGAVGIDFEDDTEVRFGSAKNYEQVFNGSNFITTQAIGGEILHVYSDGDGAYWKKMHIDSGAMVPLNTSHGLSYGSQIPLGADTQYVFWDIIVGYDWDGSDMIVECVMMLAGAEDANDDISMELGIFITSEHQATPHNGRTQVMTIDHDIGAFNTALDQNRVIFRINEDEPGEEVYAGDLIGFVMRLDNLGAPSISNGVYLNLCYVWYKTKYQQPFFDGTIPSAG